MKNKVARLQAIREIIIHSRVKSQDEILKKLHELGFDLTQATLSRDLKQLRIAKVPGNDGSYVYIMPEIGSIGKLMQEKLSAPTPLTRKTLPLQVTASPKEVPRSSMICTG